MINETAKNFLKAKGKQIIIPWEWYYQLNNFLYSQGKGNLNHEDPNLWIETYQIV